MKLVKKKYTAADGTRRESRKWYVKFSVRGRRYEEPTGTADKQAALLRAAEIVKGVELRAAGLETHEETRSASPLELVDEYHRELERTKKNACHVATTVGRLRRIISRVSALTDLTSDRIARILGELALNPTYAEDAIRKPERLSGRTQNFYRSALYSFFEWLVKAERWHRNPVAAVARVEEDTEDDPALERRALDPQELLALLAVVTDYYAAVYDLAANSGLRRNELKTLRRAQLDLDARIVTVLAKRAKSKKRRDVTLPASTCERLKRVLGEGKPEELVFKRGLPGMGTFYRHLALAKIEEDTEAGHLDFHALRTTFGTNLARSGATPAEAQQLLGHCDPRLTMRFYTKLRLHDKHAASARLDGLMTQTRARMEATSPAVAGQGKCLPPSVQADCSANNSAKTEKLPPSRGEAVREPARDLKALPPTLPPSSCISTDSIALTRTTSTPSDAPSPLAQSPADATIPVPRRGGRVAECVGFENR